MTIRRARSELEGAGWLGGASYTVSAFRDAVMRRLATDCTEPIRALVPRTVVQQWGERPEQRAVNWIGRSVSLASSGATRSRDERTLVANLGDSPKLPRVALFIEGRGDRYGLKKLVGGKAPHLTPLIATVWRGPEVLQVLSDDPLATDARNKPGDRKYFATHLLLPAAAEVWFGDEWATAGPPERPKLARAGSAVFRAPGRGGDLGL